MSVTINDETSKGVLFPDELPTFHREPASESCKPWVRWFWIPEWDFKPGTRSRQLIIGYPACNLVIQPERVMITGPTTCATYQDLRDTGWAVGALLQPAAAHGLTPRVSSLRDSESVLEAEDLVTAVRLAMVSRDSSGLYRERAVTAVEQWLRSRLDEPSQEALLANHIMATAETNTDILTSAGLALYLHLSMRTMQRITSTYIGVPPAALNRRRRLQEAANRLRAEPDLSLSRFASELGYADHVHLTHDWRNALGFNPSAYRKAASYRANGGEDTHG